MVHGQKSTVVQFDHQETNNCDKVFYTYEMEFCKSESKENELLNQGNVLPKNIMSGQI